MTIKYRYIGIFLDTDSPNDPSGLVRVWTDADGQQREETFRASLAWEPSELFDPMARPDYREFVEVDERVVERFIAEMRALYGGE